jgi:hypothetical protein
VWHEATSAGKGTIQLLLGLKHAGAASELCLIFSWWGHIRPLHDWSCIETGLNYFSSSAPTDLHALMTIIQHPTNPYMPRHRLRLHFSFLGGYLSLDRSAIPKYFSPLSSLVSKLSSGFFLDLDPSISLQPTSRCPSRRTVLDVPSASSPPLVFHLIAFPHALQKCSAVSPQTTSFAQSLFHPNRLLHNHVEITSSLLSTD